MATQLTKRTGPDWRLVVHDWRESGLTKAEFCHREGIAPSTFEWHLRRCRNEMQRQIELRRSTPRPGFVEVMPSVQAAEVSRPAAAGCVEVVVGSGYRVRVGKGFDVETLCDVVVALESLQ